MWTDFVHVVERKEAMEGKACYKNDSISYLDTRECIIRKSEARQKHADPLKLEDPNTCLPSYVGSGNRYQVESSGSFFVSW